MTFSCRPACAADYPAFADLFPQLESGDDVPSRVRWEIELAAECVMAEHDGAVVAYCYFQCFEAAGYVRHLVVDASGRRRGWARALMMFIANIMRARGCSAWRLLVKPDNAAATSLYQAVGMDFGPPSIALRLQWKLAPAPVPTLGENGVFMCVQDARDDEPLELRFDLQRGQLGYARMLPHRVVLSMRAGDQSCGVAVFNTHFPGASPFCVAEAWMAPALLQDMRPFARPEDESVSLVVDGGGELEALLLAAGAEVRMRLLTMQGGL